MPQISEKLSKELSLLYIELDRCAGSTSYQDYSRIKGMIPKCEPKEYQEFSRIVAKKLS